MQVDNCTREELAGIAHQQWAGWMIYLFSQCRLNNDGSMTIPAKYVKNLSVQMATEYVDLSSGEKDSDRAEADKYINVIVKPNHIGEDSPF